MSTKKKKVSEGWMIAVTAVVVAGGGLLAFYLLKWIIHFFFPGLF